MNQVVLIGRLTKDVDLRYTPNNTAVCHFTLAVDRPKRNGEDQGADFIKITVWGKQAENCDRYIGKGSQVGVLGRITTGSYEKDRQKVYTTEIAADRVEFLGKRGGDDCVSREPEDYSQDSGDYVQFNSLDEAAGFMAAEDAIPF